MTLGEIARPAQALLSGRLLLVGYVPTAAGALAVLTLVWAGAPGSPPSAHRAWQTATDASAGEVVVVGMALLVVALLAAPLQLSMVRVLEGGWPRWLGLDLARRRQVRRRRQLATLAVPTVSGTATAPSVEEVQRAGAVAVRLRTHYPSAEYLVRATALGNVLASMEDTAGREYGWDAVVAWPRLYPLLGSANRAIVDDRRDGLDVAARLTVTFAAVAAAAVGLLATTGWWLLIAAVPVLASAAAYRGAVAAAVAYADAVRVCFDLHRFDLIAAVHLPLPANRGEEVAVSTALSVQWRQNVTTAVTYQHP
ncbi:hypothetical protein [Frankia sp. AvcI1]|uniref:hypothetical protein n=1 Tax=Frankia sp. AvcI1 TaxID=573496 RepID=UPI002118F4A2|nr:hypothetical protein [Frankia sp. AvcI1]